MIRAGFERKAKPGSEAHRGDAVGVCKARDFGREIHKTQNHFSGVWGEASVPFGCTEHEVVRRLTLRYPAGSDKEIVEPCFGESAKGHVTRAKDALEPRRGPSLLKLLNDDGQ